jgi:hypothetical protein
LSGTAARRARKICRSREIFTRTFFKIIVVAFCASQAVDARTHHRAPKGTVPIATKPDANIPVEKNRDPADVVIDRRIISGESGSALHVKRGRRPSDRPLWL